MSPRSDRNRSESGPSTPGAACAIEKRSVRPPRRLGPTEHLATVLGSLVDFSKEQLIEMKDMKASNQGLRRDIAEMKDEWRLRNEAERDDVERRLQAEREREDRKHDERMDILKQIEKNTRVGARDHGSSAARDAAQIIIVINTCHLSIIAILFSISCYRPTQPMKR